MKVLILCTGNSCRSQMADGFLKYFDQQNRLQVFSAGTEPAKQVNPNAVRVMLEIGIDISSHQSKSVDLFLGETWDYVITVCGGANESCPAFTGDVKNRLHIGFDDPWLARGTDEFVNSEYIRVRDEIGVAFQKFYTEITK